MGQDDFSDFERRADEIFAWLSSEYSGIQPDRIAPFLLEKVPVVMYGAKTSLSHCASITSEDPRTLAVVPYDLNALPAVEAALREHLPLMEVSVNDSGVRVIAPEITQDRRSSLEDAVRDLAEEAKQSLRGAREKALGAIKRRKADSEISDDEEFSAKARLQEKVDSANEKIESMRDKKAGDVRG